MLAELPAGQHGRRRLHPLADRRGAGGVVPRNPAGRQGRAASSSIPATPMSSPGAPAARSSRRPRRAAAKCSAAHRGRCSSPRPASSASRCRAERILAALPDGRQAARRRRTGKTAARAIMTTDTFPRARPRRATIDGVQVHAQRLRQGFGHDRARHGDDAVLTSSPTRRCPPSVLQPMLSAAARPSFNCDHRRQRHLDQRHAAALRHRQQAQHARRSPASRSGASARFRRALDQVMIDLAQQVAADGEGAQKLITIDGDGRRERAGGARGSALSIANSPLVKTAIAGRGRQLGPHRHGGRQGRREGRPRQACRSRSAACRIADGRRRRRRTTTRPRSAST